MNMSIISTRRCGAMAAMLVLSAAAVVPSQAGITYTAQSRMVSASFANGGTAASMSAPDFGVFNQSVQAQSPNFQLTNAHITAIQNSSLLQTGVTATGTVTYMRFSQDATPSNGRSAISVSLTLTEPANFTLDVTSNALFHLTGPGGLMFSGGDIHTAGLAPAGNYELGLDLMIANPPFNGGSGYSFTFAVPAPGSGIVVVCGMGFMGRRRTRRRF